MTKAQDAVERFMGGMACSQAVLTTYGPVLGLEHQYASRVAAGFGSGLRMGETCGAVTGAMMVLGLALSGDNGDIVDGRRQLNEAIRELYVRFIERHGSARCSELLGCNPGTPEGTRQAIEEGLFRTRCPRFVEDAALIIEEILSKRGYNDFR